ncbi:MAG: DsrE family protein [Bacteroidales bacterium]|jgi:uncharacterized protein involved in oxidation of intracellular sulfur|nr:DsrE family protein [Bacteroidales bacterium]
MNKIFTTTVLLTIAFAAFAGGKPSLPALSAPSACETLAVFDTTKTPDIAIIITSDDAETAWNAVRLGVYAQQQGDYVVVFVSGKGLDAFMRTQSADEQFNVERMSSTFWANGGTIYSCASCATARGTETVQSCTITGIADLYRIVKQSKKVLTF